MKQIVLNINLTDDLGIKSVNILKNETDLKSDSELLKNISFGLLKSLFLNKEDMKIQDLMNELDVEMPNN